ncbi:MAG: hypothetical protein ACK53Y_03090, partial [bacterium]
MLGLTNVDVPDHTGLSAGTCPESERESDREDDREDDSGDGSDDNWDQESLSEKRARWYLEDRERDHCLQTIWKLDDDFTSNCEYSPASLEVCTSWCYACDYAYTTPARDVNG